MTDARDGPLGIRKHQCEHCPKSFKRREHWQRHTRSHTNEKPFECRFCQKCFARRDLVTRHEKTLHADDGSPNGSPTSVRRPSTAVASNDFSPTSVRSGVHDVTSPTADQLWDNLPSLAPTVSPTDPSTEGPDSHQYYMSPAVAGLEDFLDPALRVDNDSGRSLDWNAAQPLSVVTAHANGQAPEPRKPTSIDPLMPGNAAQGSTAVISEALFESSH